MIQVFYDKINTLFDGLENDQKLEIYGQLTKKVLDLELIVSGTTSPNPAPKKKWSGKKGLLYQVVKGFDPNAKGINQLLSGGVPQADHTSFTGGQIVKIQYGRSKDGNTKYFICRKYKSSPDWKFFGSSGDTVKGMMKLHDDYFEKWSDVCDFCDNYFNS